MKETPILFKPEMIRAILDDRKTQTRRLIKMHHRKGCPWAYNEYDNTGYEWVEADPDFSAHDYRRPCRCIKCPYGRKGDLLWVKEGFGLIWLLNGYALSGPPLPDKSDIKNFVPIYKNCMSDFEESLSPYFWSPLFMFKEHARIWLELTADPIPQRLQEITEEDADEECFGGDFPHKVMPELFSPDDFNMSIPECFFRVWDSINGPGTWEKNPWVWKLEFKRIET